MHACYFGDAEQFIPAETSTGWGEFSIEGAVGDCCFCGDLESGFAAFVDCLRHCFCSPVSRMFVCHMANVYDGGLIRHLLCCQCVERIRHYCGSIGRMANIIERGERFSYLLATELKQAILTYGFTVKEVATAIGVHNTTLSNYFNGSRPLPSNTFSSASEYIGVDPDDLVSRAYSRLLKELGPYRAQEAEVISIYTPASGIPLDKAAKTSTRGPAPEQVISEP